MGGNYQKNLYKQLMEVMARVDSLESEQKQDKKEIKRLTDEVTCLRKENAALREEVSSLKQENAILTEKCGKLEKENMLLRNDNERMKRILNNDSSNSSRPPSKDENTKPANMYNGRKETSRKQGAQKEHKGACLSKSDVEEKIHKGIYEHHIEEIGTSGRPYITGYRLDLDVKTVATEIRIYADDTGKYQVPPEITVVGSTTSSAGGLNCPLQGHVAFPPEGGLTNHVHYVTGGRLKAASFVLTLRTILPIGHSHTAHRYTSLLSLHLHYRQSRNNIPSPRSGGHTGLCTPDVCRKASDCSSP